MDRDKKYYYVYILSDKKRGTTYIGVTSRIVERVIEHRLKVKPGFPEKYELFRLVHYEVFDYVDLAICREKQLKKWKREWKIELIESENKEWKDLLPEIADKEQRQYAINLISGNKDFYEER